MPINSRSRYFRVQTTQIVDENGERTEVYDLGQTTVLPEDLPLNTDWYAVKVGEDFESISENAYFEIGGHELWWVLAMVNPDIIYPLDLKVGDQVLVPPSQWVEEFLDTPDDWTFTWLRVYRDI